MSDHQQQPQQTILLTDHAAHHRLRYYPSNKFCFESSVEHNFFAKSWPKSVNYAHVDKLYKLWPQFVVEQTDWLERRDADVRQAIECPCSTIIAFNVLRMGSFYGLTNLLFNNQHDMRTAYFTTKIEASFERANIQTAFRHFDFVTFEMYISLVRSLPSSSQSNVFKTEKTRIKKRVERIATHLNYALKLERSATETYETTTRDQLVKLVSTDIDAILANPTLTPLQRTALFVNHHRQLRIYLRRVVFLDKNPGHVLASDDVNPMYTPKLRSVARARDEAYTVLFRNTAAYLHCWRKNVDYVNRTRCLHKRRTHIFKQTRANDEIETKIVYCLDCRREIAKT